MMMIFSMIFSKNIKSKMINNQLQFLKFRCSKIHLISILVFISKLIKCKHNKNKKIKKRKKRKRRMKKRKKNNMLKKK